MRIAGLLLAGGRALRFGSEKAVQPLGGGVMMDGPLAALRAVCLTVAVSARVGSGAQAHAQALGLHGLQDADADAEGPLAGIHRGLAWAAVEGFDWLAVAPCDTPTLCAADYRALIQAAAEGVAAVVGEGRQGMEPLVSLWSVTVGRDAVASALADGGHPAVRQVLIQMGAVSVRLSGYDGLNVNTPDDLSGL